MPASQSLAELIQQRKLNENACRDAVAKSFSKVLLPLDEHSTYVNVEYSNEAGRTDVVVIGERRNAEGDMHRVAYVWELKAPQLFLFEAETSGRARPTIGLFLAENQVLHYHAVLAGSEAFRSKWKILRREDVQIGGVVIGRYSTLCKGAKGNVALDGLARFALRVRRDMFYSRCGLRLMTWDKLLELTTMLKTSNRRVTKATPPKKKGGKKA